MLALFPLLLFLFDLNPEDDALHLAGLHFPVQGLADDGTGASAQQPTQATRSMLNSRSAVVWPSLIEACVRNFPE